MKKFTYFLIALFVSSLTLLSGCGNNGNTIRVNEVTHSIFYAPMYVAMNKGYFKEENINIKLTNGGGSNVSMTALISNSADVALLGPETAVYVAAEGKKDLPIVFGQLTKRDGSFLVGRNAVPAGETFDWNSLKGKDVLGGRQGGMPAMTLEYVIKKHGLEIGTGPDQVNVRYDIEFNNMTAAFTGGTGDYVTIFEPTATSIEREGKGHIVASVGEAASEVPFTTFMANESYIAKNRDRLKGFLRAVMKGYEFIISADIEEVIDSLIGSFDAFTRDDIRASILSYKRIDAWMNTPVMQEADYNRLIDVITQAGTLDKSVPFESIVDNSLALEVMSEKK